MALVLQFTFVKANQQEVIVMDASLDETHSYAADVTEFPVESGSAINDNVRPRPIQLRFNAFISDFPLQGIAKQIASSGPQPRLAPGLSRAQNELDKLNRLRSEGTVIKVVTGLRVYENMVIETIDVNRDKTISKGIRLSLALKEVKVVSTQTAQIVALEPKGQNKLASGPKSKAPATEAEKKASLASGVFDNATGGLKNLLQKVRAF